MKEREYRQTLRSIQALIEDIDAVEAQIFDDRDRRYLARVCTWIPTP